MSSIWHVEAWLNLFFLTMAAAVISFSFALRTDEERGIFVPGTSIIMPATCTSRALYGIECPGCGLTRAFVAISHGRFSRAWELNRASFLVYTFVLSQIPWHLIQFYRRSQSQLPLQWPTVYWIPLLLAFVLVVNWICKMIGW